MDKYDLEIERITKAVDNGDSEAIWGAWFHATCLFQFASRSGRTKKSIGCLTMIRHNPKRFHAETEALTEEISKDERIPKNENGITIKTLPVFAEWQRRLDKELRTRNELTKLKPEEFEKILGVKILDPDGWDRKDPEDFGRPITIYEFLEKVMPSTVSTSAEFRKEFWK
jgi:hypothetical protein